MPNYPLVKVGQQTVGTSAVQLPSVNLGPGPLNQPPGAGIKVVLMALAANTGKIYIGSSTGVLTTTGFELAAGQQSPPMILNDLDLLWAIASAAAQQLAYLVTIPDAG
jgi:hypothetical protein